MIKVIKYRLKMIRRNPVISPILLPGVTLYSTLSTYKIRIKPFLSEKGRKRERERLSPTGSLEELQGSDKKQQQVYYKALKSSLSNDTWTIKGHVPAAPWSCFLSTGNKGSLPLSQRKWEYDAVKWRTGW
jgi:hypothetical protein